MRIGYFTLRFPYHEPKDNYLYGGSTLAAYFLALEMVKNGHEVRVFTTSADSKDTTEKYNNMEIYRYGVNYKILSSNISLGLFTKPIAHNVDIAHVHFDIPPSPLAGLRYVNKKKVPLIVTYHGDWIQQYGNIFRRLGILLNNKFIVDKLLNKANAIISPSHYYISNSSFLKKYIEKTVAIPNGLNLDDFTIPYTKKQSREMLGIVNDCNVILYLSHLSPFKGPDILLKAMPYVLNKMPETVLIMVGEGVMKSNLYEISKTLQIENKVFFTGSVQDTLKKALYYKAADVFVLPSLAESFGMVILEAMASGIPVVASKVGGVVDIVNDGETGLFIQPRNSEAIAKAVLYLLEKPEFSREMGIKGKEKAKLYTWDKIALQTISLYEDVL